MDKNSIIGLVLIAGILFVFAYMNQPEDETTGEKDKQEQTEPGDSAKVAEIEEEVEPDSTKKVNPDSNVTSTESVVNNEVVTTSTSLPQVGDTSYVENDTSYVIVQVAGDTVRKDSAEFYQLVHDLEKKEEIKQASQRYGAFSDQSTGTAESHVLENEDLKVTFTNKGAMVKRVELKNYLSYQDYADGKSTDEASLVLLDSNNFYGFEVIRDLSNSFFTDELYFSTITATDDSLVYRASTNDGKGYIDFVYTLTDPYGLDFDVRLLNLREHIEKLSSFRWTAKARHVEKSRSQEDMVAGIFYQYTGEGRDYISETSDGSEKIEASPDWIAFKQQFFTAAIISHDAFGPGGEMGHEVLPEGPYIKSYFTNLTNVNIESLTQETIDMHWYFGPNDYNLLETYELGMEDIVNLGPSIFGWINENFFIHIFNWLADFGWGMGLVILLLTILVRVIITPLVFRNYRSSAKMRVLKPEMEEITNKYPDQKDAMKRQQAQMALYRSTGVNPLAGCIPMLIQMPILFAMFRFIPSALELRQASFLWADDLSSYDVIANLPFEIPWYGDHVSLFTLLMATSTLIYTISNSGQMTQSNPNMPNMKFIMYLFPIMMIFFFNSYAAGLSYYYFLSNLMSMGIMFTIKKYFIDEDKLRAQIETNKKKPKKKSKFQQRLAEMQRQNEQRRKQKGGKK